MTGGKVGEVDTDCRKCGESMPPTRRPPLGVDAIAAVFRVTAFRCPKCDHWNDLERRKPRRIDPDEVRK